jgi:hypothetical protein
MRSGLARRDQGAFFLTIIEVGHFLLRRHGLGSSECYAAAAELV